VLALLLQLTACVGVLLIVALFSLHLSATAIAVCCGLLAAGLSYYAGLALWWLAIQFAFAPAVLLTLTLHIPPPYFLGLFLLLWLVYWNTFRTQVPLYLSSTKVWLALENRLPPVHPGQHFKFIDIGSGLGGVLTHLARVRPDGDYTGVESAPLPYIWSWLRIRIGGYRQCQVYWGDFWSCNLADFDVVYAYLSPAPMARLWQKAQTEMKPGAVFISSTFSVPGQSPTQTIQIDDLHRSTLLIWRM
jgi:energy-coupling factor transporter transmembrane protein EcfT